MNTEQRKVNEKYFIGIMRLTKCYTWIDTGNIYNIENNKFKPTNLKGYVELAGITTRPFMELFVELPDNSMSKEKIWRIIESVDTPKKKNKSSRK